MRAALRGGVKFDRTLDKFGEGTVTALFVIHSGRGAEVTARELQGRHIWSHKWKLRNPVKVAPDLFAATYLVVPNDCTVGVCAHELGHLAFQWQDFNDPNYNEDGTYWDGTAIWDWLASGSYNGDGSRPAHPAPLHKLQHRWIRSTTGTASQSLKIEPYAGTSAEVFKAVSPDFGPKQYSLLENRKKTGFDFDLPDEGLLVWKVGEPMEMNSKTRAGLTLVQADGSNELDHPYEGNQGDAGAGGRKKQARSGKSTKRRL